MNYDKKMEIYGDIYRFLDTPTAREWAKQNKNPYCFLKFDPFTKQITICRWGKTLRPPRTDAMYWQRLKIQSFSIDNKTFDALSRWLGLWDRVAFNPHLSDQIPPVYPNTIYSRTMTTHSIFQSGY